jgi:Glycosyl transferases group 1
MKIAVIGETRFPVLPYSSGGLARMTYDHASQFLNLGHDVTLFAMEGSGFERLDMGQIVYSQYDAILDMTHEHAGSQTRGYDPILNLIGDRECQYQPPNSVVQSEYMQKHYPKAKFSRAGVDVDSIPFGTGGDYLVFIGHDWHKQSDVAKWAAYRTGKRIVMLENSIPADVYRVLGGALGLLCPYTIDASPRAPLEAAACGTPTICLDGDGTRSNVYNDVTGFVCSSPRQMDEAIGQLKNLNRGIIRKWVEDNHNIKQTALDVLRMLEAVANGARW